METSSWENEPYYPPVGELAITGYHDRTIPLCARDPERIGEITAKDIVAIERQINHKR